MTLSRSQVAQLRNEDPFAMSAAWLQPLYGLSALGDLLAAILGRSARAGQIGVSVRVEESALFEAIELGLVHPSLAEEPRAA